MDKQTKGFVWIGLGVSVFLALFLSPFASPSPDGLERVAEDHGFLEKGEGWTLWRHAPFGDYTLPWIKDEKVSTAIAGLIGTLGIFMITMGVAKLLRKKKAG